jgi:hypothetical protein
MTYCSKNYFFSTAFKLCSQEIFAKGENRLSNFAWGPGEQVVANNFQGAAF